MPVPKLHRLRFPSILLAAVAASLSLASAAGAATIGDLAGLGYTVGVASQSADCTTYAISGNGIGVYANSCSADFQATVDSIANPEANCNRVWQSQHPDQYGALQRLGSRGYVVSGDQCADSYVVSQGGSQVYSGSAAGLVGLADQADAAPAAAKDAPALDAPPVASTCLPLSCSFGQPAPAQPVSASPTNVERAAADAPDVPAAVSKPLVVPVKVAAKAPVKKPVAKKAPAKGLHHAPATVKRRAA